MSVHLLGVTRRLARDAVVDRVTLRIEEGELFVLLGASGSGKSTILRIIAGLADCDEGRIEMHGRDVTRLPPQQREVGLVFQSYSVFPHATVSENVEFGLRIRGVAPAARAARRDELLELVHLGGLGNRRPHQLSGGQLQRVALARALACRPRVLLLDEPFGALDARTRLQLRRSLAETQRTIGITTLLVTHDQDEAFELADRIGLIDRGRLVEVGTARDLYARPRRSWTAGFIGGGCVFLGRVRGRQAELGSLRLDIPTDVPHEEGGWVRVLVRPEQFLLSSEEPTDGGHVLGRGEVIGRTFMGSSERLRIRLPRPRGVRQLSPRPPFGEEGLLVEALVPASASSPASTQRKELPWVCLGGWHVLEQPAARILVHGGEAGASEPFVTWMRECLGATTTLATTALPEGAAARPLGVATRVRYYDLAMAVLEESGDDRAVADVLEAVLETPLLLVPRGSMPRGPVLICTAVGEAGKADIRVGAWLARRLEERVTLLHVWTRQGAPPQWLAAHLARGLATLRANGVEPELVVRPARHPQDGILEQLALAPHSLLVVGASAPAGRLGSAAFGARLARATRRPVLVVPADAM